MPFPGEGFRGVARWRAVVLAVELSGEHAELAQGEVAATATALGGSVVKTDLPRIALVEGPVDADRLAQRLALAWRIVDVHERCGRDLDAIVDAGSSIDLAGASFSVRCSRLDAGIEAAIVKRLERELGTTLSSQASVDLEQPEAVVRILLEEDEAVVGIEAARIDRSSYEERHVELRPHHSPITLPPRLARAMVNLTGVPDEGRLWDPFAGTGGIALEAATIGAQTVASDNDPVMVEGTQAAFEHFGVEANAEAREGDFSKVADELGTVDAIATDPPYGRASNIGDEALGELYERFFACAERVLEPGGRLVAAFPDPSAIDTAPATFTLVEHHAWYVHASLTRHVLVLER